MPETLTVVVTPDEIAAVARRLLVMRRSGTLNSETIIAEMRKDPVVAGMVVQTLSEALTVYVHVSGQTRKK